MDRLKALEIFKSVAERGSFVRTADALDLATPTVTRAVQNLERLLGLRLLQRSTRSVMLTPEGKDVLDRARGLLSSFEELEAISSALSLEVAGDIRLSAPVSFGVRRLGPILASFTSKYPKARIDLQLTDVAVNLIESGVDLALRISRELPDSLVARRVGNAALGVFGSPEYLRRRGAPEHPSELHRHECLSYNGALNASRWTLTHQRSEELFEHRPQGGLNTNNADALLAAAVHGMGLVLLPNYLAEEAVARGELQPVLASWTAPALGVFLTYASREHQPQRVRKLIDHLAQALSANQRPVEKVPRGNAMTGRFAPKPLAMPSIAVAA